MATAAQPMVAGLESLVDGLLDQHRHHHPAAGTDHRQQQRHAEPDPQRRCCVDALADRLHGAPAADLGVDLPAHGSTSALAASRSCSKAAISAR
jgi:hypothetical protein